MIGHAQEGTAPDYGEYAINTMLGPAIDKTRSPFDIGPEEGNEDIAPFVAAFPDEPEPNRLPMTETGNPLGEQPTERAEPAANEQDEREAETAL